ncbi:signal peptidase I [bacterium]|nr:signal peptidase I [bacterium]
MKEKRSAYWLKFKSKLPENLQNSLDNFEERYRAYKETALCEIIETIVFVLVMVIIIRFFVGEIRWIPSGSMKPTLIEGDRIIVERFSRFYTGPQRGDIMVFYPPSTTLSRKPLPLLSRLTGIFCKDIAYIKRVIGLPGDEIEIKPEKDGSAYVYINGEKYEEDYIKSVYEYPDCSTDKDSKIIGSEQLMKCGPFKLGKDDYFMMGDNRGSSFDSRYWGKLKKDRFVGRAVTVFWPINRVKILHRGK